MRRRLVVLLVTLGTLAAAPPARAAILARADLDPAWSKQAIARHFLGFSAEYTGLADSLALPGVGPNTALAGLFSTLDRGNGAPVLRIGGGSADDAFWSPVYHRPAGGLGFWIGPPFTAAVGAFQRLTGAPLIITLNLAHRRPALATDWAAAAMQAFGRRAILAFEVGNEPDIYAKRPLGKLKRARPHDYSPAAYGREFARFRTALDRLSPRPPLSGYDTCCLWDSALPRFLARERRHLKMLSVHQYPFNTCVRRSAPEYPTTDRLLGNHQFFSVAARYRALQAIASRFHLPVRLSETNSSACIGKRGVNDTFTSALWGTDWLFLAAAYGFTGVNFHVNGLWTPYYTGAQGGRYLVGATPLYYSMLLFSEATAGAARFIPGAFVHIRPRRGARVRLWATYRRGEMRAVLVNGSRRAGGRVLLTVRRATGAATLRRLTAPSLGSRKVSFAGQRLATDGTLRGPEVVERVARHGTTFSFSLPAASAALVTIPVRSG